MTGASARAWWLTGALCGVVVIADQVSKRLVEDNVVVGEEVGLLGPVKLTLTHNEGVAFGLAGGSGAVLVIVSLLALAVVLYFFLRQPARPLMWVATGLLTGGAIGNLIDRVRVEHVTDFIHLPHWPAFNLADSAITCGVLLLVVVYLRDVERARDDG